MTFWHCLLASPTCSTLIHSSITFELQPCWKQWPQGLGHLNKRTQTLLSRDLVVWWVPWIIKSSQCNNQGFYLQKTKTNSCCHNGKRQSWNDAASPTDHSKRPGEPLLIQRELPREPQLLIQVQGGSGPPSCPYRTTATMSPKLPQLPHGTCSTFLQEPEHPVAALTPAALPSSWGAHKKTLCFLCWEVGNAGQPIQ